MGIGWGSARLKKSLVLFKKQEKENLGIEEWAASSQQTEKILAKCLYFCLHAHTHTEFPRRKEDE